MNSDRPFPQRYSIRLKQFDYAQPGAWFITICAHDKKCIFGNVAAGEVRLNRLGRLVNETWLEIPRHFPNVELHGHVVMPNHLHALFAVHPTGRARHAVPLHSDHALAEAYQQPIAGSVPTIIRSFKSAASKRVHEELPRFTAQIWQRNYYESRIRNENDARNALLYILENPARWRVDNYHPIAPAPNNPPHPSG